MMRTSHILMLCILGHALLSSVTCSAPSGAVDCCLTFYQGRVKEQLIASYYMTDQQCPMTAAVLVTKKNRRICVDPSLSWVVDIMTSLDESTF